MTAPTLRDQIAHVRGSVAPFYGLGADVYHPVRLRPSLGFALVPRPRRRAEPQPTEVTGRTLAAAAALAVPPRLQAGGLGLVEGAESVANGSGALPARGLRGLTAHGARSVEDLCHLSAQDRYTYGLWTVTIPRDAAALLDRTPAGFQRFQDAIRRRFSEALRRAAKREQARTGIPIPPYWWFVVEPQKDGTPHIHMVFRSKSRRGRTWLLRKGSLDRLIRNCLRVVTGATHRVNAAGNVQALRTNPGRYLSKYLRKEHRAGAGAYVMAQGYSGNMVPRQWWGASPEAMRWLFCHTVELPARFVGWLSRQWPLLNGMGLLSARIWEPEADGAPSIVVGRFASPAAMARVVEHLAHLAERGDPSGRVYGWT